MHMAFVGEEDTCNRTIFTCVLPAVLEHTKTKKTNHLRPIVFANFPYEDPDCFHSEAFRIFAERFESILQSSCVSKKVGDYRQTDFGPTGIGRPTGTGVGIIVAGRGQIGQIRPAGGIVRMRSSLYCGIDGKRVRFIGLDE